MSSPFSRQPPSTRPKRLTPAADAFVTGAEASAITPATQTDAPATAAPPSPALVPAPDKEPEVSSQTVRFTAREKAALQRLARHQRRSEHFIIKDILGPALLRAASELDAS